MVHSLVIGGLYWQSGTVQVKPELAKWEGHVVTVSNVRDELWVALEKRAKEARQHTGQEDLPIQGPVAGWVCLADVECVAH